MSVVDVTTTAVPDAVGARMISPLEHLTDLHSKT